ncbi:MAG: aspartyl protease family protein [Nevskia sp.]|nr:aspartyl protease family protein [Nevskia sp.]
MQIRTCLWPALMLGLMLPSTLRADEAQGACRPSLVAELDVVPNQQGALLVPVQIGGQDELLAVDTGAFWSVLRGSLVQGLPSRTARVAVIGAGGQVLDRYVKVPSFRVGQLDLRGVDFYVGPDAPGDDARVGGNLGANVLAKQDLELDPGAGKVRLYARDRCRTPALDLARKDVQALPLELEHNLISIAVTLDGKPLRALIDTGASSSVLSLDVARELFGLSPDSPGVQRSAESSTLDGRRLQMYEHIFDSLTLGGVVFRQPLLTLAKDNIGPAGGWKVLGEAPQLILGMHELRRLHLYVDYGSKTLYVATAGDAHVEAAAAAAPAMANPLDVNHARLLAQSAQAHAARHEYELALHDLDEAIRYLPGEARLYLSRGAVQLQRKAYPAALADLDRGVELDAGNAAAYYDRGLAYQASGQRQQALRDYERTLQLDPNFVHANLARAELYLAEGRAGMALADLDRALDLEPASSEALQARCFARASLKQVEAARGDCDRAIAADPADLRPLYTRAVLALNGRRLAAAIRDYSAILQRDPTQADALYGRGLARRDSGDIAGGRADMAAALKLDPAVTAHFTSVRMPAAEERTPDAKSRPQSRPGSPPTDR